MKNRLTLVLALIATAVATSAQTLVSFTFSGTADSDTLGYTSGQAVSFTFVFADAAPDFTADGQNSVVWRDYGQSGQRLIQSVSGTGITGTWQAPVVGGGADYNSYFQVEHSPTERFGLSVNTFDYDASPVNSSGLQANGYDLGQIMIDGYNVNPLGFGTLPASGNPLDFLSDYTGSYDVNLFASIYDIGDNNSLGFAISNITISNVSAVPEPSTYAAIFGGLALVGAIWRRRRAAERSGFSALR